MARARNLDGFELWPVPGFRAMGVVTTPDGSAPVALHGPADAERVVVLAGESLPVLRGLANHLGRRGVGVLAIGGRPGPDGDVILRAAKELAELRGAVRVGFGVHGAWARPGLLAAPGLAEVLAVVDPSGIGDADPQRLRGIPLWVGSGEEAAAEARGLHARARHPRTLVELAHVPRLENAVNDVSAALVPFLVDGLAGQR